MRSSSDTIAQLASALAKAQMELVNPVKTLRGVIDRWGSGNEGQTYSYAPLSAGLDIVRKTLCKHELAVIQTTDLDRDSAMVLLTTTLAHGSGEWISAIWPVCRMADMSNPKLMGAALTYARRYGLFTLVGIAGEDDLDGPPPLSSETDKPEASAAISGERQTGPARSETEEIQRAGPGAPPEAPNVSDDLPVGRENNALPRRKRNSVTRPNGAPVAPGDASRQLNRIRDADGLFRWALDVLPARNRMSGTDREMLDAAFTAKAEELGAEDLLVVLSRASAAEPNGTVQPFPT